MYSYIVFIHRSIKTRIETLSPVSMLLFVLQFLYIDPLKQGLKRQYTPIGIFTYFSFLYIDPLKQGLKRSGA